MLLCVPPGIEHLEIYRIAGVRAPPLGLAWIAAVLENDGHEVSIIDSPTLSLSVDDFIRRIKAFKPDLVGFTAITPTIYKAYSAARIVKQIYPDIPVIIGGPHVTFMYEEALSKPYIDVVICGEGEYTTLELVNKVEKYGFRHDILKDIRGIAYRYNGKIIVTKARPLIKNLDDLPKPARHLLPIDRYTLLDKPIKVFHIMASRGCPYGCIYCSTSYFWGRKVRFRNVDLIIDEIRDAVEKYKIRNIVFTDDELTINKKWIFKLCNKIRREKLDISFGAGSRVDRGSLDCLYALKQAGCETVYYGVESGSEYTLRKIGKGITINMIEKAFENTKKLGIETVGSFILGFPWESLRDMTNTIKFSIKLKPNYAQFTVLTPYPGTPIFYQAKKEGLIEDFNWEHYTTLKAVMRGYKFTREMLQKMLTKAYREFYLRMSFMLEQVIKKRIDVILSILKKQVIPMIKRDVFRC